jgi:glycosyltransferase involved in cell wall biosynthesis
MTSVAHVIELSEALTGATFSGAENHLFTLMEGQSEAGCAVTLYALVGRYGPMLEARFRALEAAGVRVVPIGPRHRWPRPLHRTLRAAGTLSLAARLAAHRPDIVHTHLLLASQLGRTAAAIARRPVVESTHCDEPEFTRPWVRRRLQFLDRFTRRHIAISAHVARHLSSTLGVEPSRIDVVHYGIPPPGPERSRLAMRSELGLPSDAFVVTFVGRLAPQKNVDVLIEALKGMNDVCGLVVGSGPLEGELRALAEHRGAPVRFLGFRADAPEIIGASDVFCLPSRWEGLGLVLLEAMVRGTPIVASDAGAIPEILRNGDFGRVVPVDDAEALRAAVEDLRKRPAPAEALASRAREYALREFTVPMMVERTLATYSEALTDLSRRRGRRHVSGR